MKLEAVRGTRSSRSSAENLPIVVSKCATGFAALASAAPKARRDTAPDMVGRLPEKHVSADTSIHTFS
eukprot:6985616-Prymnesium_polylepis.2